MDCRAWQSFWVAQISRRLAAWLASSRLGTGILNRISPGFGLGERASRQRLECYRHCTAILTSELIEFS